MGTEIKQNGTGPIDSVTITHDGDSKTFYFQVDDYSEGGDLTRSAADVKRAFTILAQDPVFSKMLYDNLNSAGTQFGETSDNRFFININRSDEDELGPEVLKGTWINLVTEKGMRWDVNGLDRMEFQTKDGDWQKTRDVDVLFHELIHKFRLEAGFFTQEDYNSDENVRVNEERIATEIVNAYRQRQGFDAFPIVIEPDDMGIAVQGAEDQNSPGGTNVTLDELDSDKAQVDTTPGPGPEPTQDEIDQGAAAGNAGTIDGGPGGPDGTTGTPDGDVDPWLQNPVDPNGSGISDPVDDGKDKFDTGENKASPIILDLDDDGIELTALSTNNTTYFDLDNDGFAEMTGFVKADDAILVHDVNGDGIINDTSEWFGTADTDGFTVLKQHDANGDLIIDVADAIWEDLRLWRDLDQDGVSDGSEFFMLSEYDIVSIDLNATEVSQTNQGHSVTHTSTFTIDDGVNPSTTQAAHDIWFNYDDTATLYAQNYTFDMRTAYLPSMRGYGTVPNLHIAMSLDNTGTGNLLTLVDTLHDLTFAQLFDETATIPDDVKDIMYRWAGVDGVAVLSRGPNIDARQLEFLETFLGEHFFQTGSAHQQNPGPDAAAQLEEGFHGIFNHVYAALLMQSAGGELFTGNHFYSVGDDAFVGITGLDSTKLSSLETEATNLANTAEREVFWQNVVRMVEFSVGTDNLPAADKTALDDAINDSDATLTLSGILSDLDYAAPTGTTYNGTSGNDTLTTDTSDHDTLNGLAGDDTITASTGNDTLDGGAGDDILTGGVGNDYLKGDLGDDEYHHDAEDGYDIIIERGTGTGNDNDKIMLGPNIDINDLTITRITNAGLLIQIDNGTDDPSEILIEDQFNYAAGGGHVELIEFDDTSTHDLDAQSYTLTGTAFDDELYGSRYGSDESDTIYGGDGNDTIYGYAPNQGGGDTEENWLYGQDGNDTLYGGGGIDNIEGGNGDDVLDGGAGADILDGGAGNDTYSGEAGDDVFVYLSGHDTITDLSGTNDIHLDAVWDSITPEYFQIGNNLQIYWDDDNTISVINHFTTGEMNEMIYDDTTTVDLTTITATQQGTSGNDTLYGTSGDDIIYGFAGDDNLEGSTTASGYGNDTLYGGPGDDDLDAGNDNDYLDGGAGDDQLSGGNGNDHFFYVSGHDVADELGGTDILEMDSGWVWDDLTFARYDANPNDLVIEINSENSITIDNMFYSSRQIETLRMNDGTGDVNLLNLHYTTYGTTGNDSITGITNSNFSSGDVNDTIYGLDGNDTISGNDGNDTLYGDDGNDTLNGNNGNDTIDGGAGDDTIRGHAGDDTFYFYGGGGLDTLYDTGGTDVLNITGGLTINDITVEDVSTYDAKVVVTASTDEMTIDNLRSGSATFHVDTIAFDDGFTVDLPSYNSWNTGTASGDTLTDGGSDAVFVGYDGNDDITGDGGADSIHGGAGDDDIDGAAGNDVLFGGADDDTIIGGTGDDEINGGPGGDTVDYSGDGAAVTVNLSTGTATDGNSDTDTLDGIENITGSDYNDTLTGDSGNNVFIGGDGDDTVDGGAGTDRVNYSADVAAVTVNLSTGSATDGNSDTDTLSNVENVTGSAYNDTITGDGNANQLDGGAGNDSLTGGAGDDVLEGGTGDDTLNGGDDSDTVDYGSDAAGVTVNLSTGSATDGNGDTDTISNTENVNGSIYNDTITGSSSANILNAGIGNDTLNGNGGDDLLLGQAGTDTLNGGDGDDLLFGGDDADTLNGGNDNDTLYGGTGGDTLHGDAGDDVLYGQDGLDTLYGDGGADTFIFTDNTAFNDIDVVKDFDTSTDDDVLDISDILFLNGYEDGVDDITDWVQIADSGSDSTVKVDVTGTGTFGAGTQIATLEGITGLTDEAALVSSGNLVVA